MIIFQAADQNCTASRLIDFICINSACLQHKLFSAAEATTRRTSRSSCISERVTLLLRFKWRSITFCFLCCHASVEGWRHYCRQLKPWQSKKLVLKILFFKAVNKQVSEGHDAAFITPTLEAADVWFQEPQSLTRDTWSIRIVCFWAYRFIWLFLGCLSNSCAVKKPNKYSLLLQAYSRIRVPDPLTQPHPSQLNLYPQTQPLPDSNHNHKT